MPGSGTSWRRAEQVVNAGPKSRRKPRQSADMRLHSGCLCYNKAVPSDLLTAELRKQ